MLPEPALSRHPETPPALLLSLALLEYCPVLRAFNSRAYETSKRRHEKHVGALCRRGKQLGNFTGWSSVLKFSPDSCVLKRPFETSQGMLGSHKWL